MTFNDNYSTIGELKLAHFLPYTGCICVMVVGVPFRSQPLSAITCCKYSVNASGGNQF